MIIDIMAEQQIMTFPDYPLSENARIIVKQCNVGYTKILDVISKIKTEVKNG